MVRDMGESVATILSFPALFSHVLLDCEYLGLDLKHNWENCSELAKLVAFTRGLFGFFMVRSLGTPQTRGLVSI